KSDKFRAVSASTGSLSPSWVTLGGLGYASKLAQRGLTAAHDPVDPVWKEVSAALNARADLPPLLWQSPDSERWVGEEAWFRLRTAGAQVEWWEYPNEPHIKESPANRWWVQHRNLDWFRFWLQGVEDPAPGKAEQYRRWREMRAAIDQAGAP